MTTRQGDDARAGQAQARVLRLLVPGLGVLLLVAELPFIMASGLMAPGWAVIALLLVWAGLLWLGIVWFRPHPWRVIALPVVAAVVWFATMSAGDAFLGWTP